MFELMCSMDFVHYELYNTLIQIVFFEIILGILALMDLYKVYTVTLRLVGSVCEVRMRGPYARSVCEVRMLGSYGNILTQTCLIHIERYKFCSFSSINTYLCFITTVRSHTICRLDRIKINDNCLNRWSNLLFQTLIENRNYPIHTSVFELFANSEKSFRNRLKTKITFNNDHCCDYVLHNQHTLILTAFMRFVLLLFININLIQISRSSVLNRSIIHESLKQCNRYKHSRFNINFKLVFCPSIIDTKLKQLITSCTKIIKENRLYMNSLIDICLMFLCFNSESFVWNLWRID